MNQDVYEWHVLLQVNGKIADKPEIITVASALQAAEAIPDGCGEILAIVRGRKLAPGEAWGK